MSEQSRPDKDTTRRCLPVGEWPAADRVAWIGAHRRGGLLDDDGLAASWAPATSSIIAGGYGRWLAYLAEEAALDICLPQYRVTRTRVDAYVARLHEFNHSSTVAARAAELARALGVMAPASDWSWLRRTAKRLARSATPARNDRGRLLPASTLEDLAYSLMQRAETAISLPDWRRSLLYRDGLMIALLCACAPRARNIAAITIGLSLQRRGDVFWVVFGSNETKNGRHFEVPLPVEFTARAERYLEHYRPQLAGRAAMPLCGNGFWLSHTGRPLTAKEVGKRVSVVTRRELGQSLNPHLFRKIIPTELAIHDPANVGIAQPLLGHASYQTTEQAYNLGQALDAARRVQRTIQSIRTASRPVPVR